MQLAVDALSWALLLAGCAFMLVGGLGMLRLPDFYSRIHAAGMTDSLAAPLMLLGLALQSGWSLVTIKLLTVWIFLWISSPSSSHAVAKAAYGRGVRVPGRIHSPFIGPAAPSSVSKPSDNS